MSDLRRKLGIAKKGEQVSVEKQAEDTIRKARLLARTCMPYFTLGLNAMSINVTNKAVDDVGNPTFAIDKKFRMYAHPEAINNWVDQATKVSQTNKCPTCGGITHHPLAYIAGVLVHEMLHPLRKHFKRALAYDQKTFQKSIANVACFPAGAYVHSGKKIEDVATMISDFEGDLIEIRTQGGTVQATPEHPFFSKVRRHKVGIKPIVLNDPEWVTTENLRVGDFVLIPKTKITTNVESIDLSQFSGENRAIKSITLTENVAWMMGLYVAEGSSSGGGVQFSLNIKKDQALVRRLEIVAAEIGRGFQKFDYEDRGVVSVNISSVVLYRWLADTCGAGAYNKKIPGFILQHSNSEIRKAFIQGMVDGDGCVVARKGSSKRNCLTYSTVSEGLAYDLTLLLAQDGIGVHRTKQELKDREINGRLITKKSVIHNVHWNPAGNSKSTRIMNGRAITSTHGRTKTDEHGVWYPIKSIKKVPFTGKVYNLINTPDHTYIVNGMLVHNCDLEINDSLVDYAKSGQRGCERMCLPKGALLPSIYKLEDNLLWEQYYAQILQKIETGEIKAQKIPAGGRCGSGADGHSRGYELGDDESSAGSSGDKEGEGDLQGDDGISETEIDIIAKRTAEEIKAANGKKPGSVPGNLVRWADRELAPPKYNWRKELTLLVRYSVSRYVPGAKTPTYSRLSNISTMLNHEVILPTLKKPHPVVAVVVDTSGSMGSADENGLLGAALRETEGILRSVKARTNVIFCDTVAQKVKLRSLKGAKVGGGGGTTLFVGMESALKDREKPSLIIVLTDGYDNFEFKQPAGVRVIVGLLGKDAPTGSIPKWCHIVKIDEV